MTISLPEFCLVALVGASGSGKTTFAHEHFQPGEVLFSDAFRLLVSGDENAQDAPATPSRRCTSWPGNVCGAAC